MIRRSFIQTLGVALLPQSLFGKNKLTQPIRPLPAKGIGNPVENSEPEWLRDWRKIPKIEFLSKDIFNHKNWHQRETAQIILTRIKYGKPLIFQYYGGSDHGATRTVLPTLLFRLDYVSHYQACAQEYVEFPAPDESPLYLLGWCQTRQAPRYFRLDRVQLLEANLDNLLEF